MQILTFDELKQRREEGLAGSEKAIHLHGDTYHEIKRLLNEINGRTIDVADYYQTARHLSTLLTKMTNGIGKSIFHYFADHIDPCKSGDARCFRMECSELLGQIQQLDQWRAARRRLSLIK